MNQQLVFGVMEDMIMYFHEDVRRINHALKVHAFASLMAAHHAPDDMIRLVIEISALLHDIGIKEAEQKYQSSAGIYQEREGPIIARQILAEYEMDSDLVERVCHIIGNHHSYQKIDGIDFQILVEADFLVNIHEDEMGTDSIIRIQDKIFKTEAGMRILQTMYPT